MRRSPEIKIIIGSCAALALLVWAVVGALVWFTQDREIEEAYRDASASSRVFAEQVGRTIRGIESQLSFAAHEIRNDPDPSKLKQLVEAGALSMDTLVQIAFVNDKSETVATQLGPEPSRQFVGDRPHIQIHFENPNAGFFISRPVLGRVSGKWAIQISRRVERADGRLVGILVASLDPYYFQRFWVGLVPGPGDVVELIGADGRLLTRSRDLEWALTSAVERKSVVMAAERAPSGRFEERSPDGVDRIAFFQSVPDHPLVVATGYARSDVLARAAGLVRVYLGVGATMTLVIMSLGLWLSSLANTLKLREREAQIVNRRMNEAVEAVSEGFALFDASDRLILANEAFKRCYPKIAQHVRPGVSFERLAEAGVAAGQWPEASENPEEWKRRLIARHREIASAYEIQTDDGRWLRVSERATAEGGVVGIRTDISDIKRREQALVEAHHVMEEQAREVSRLAKAAQKASEAKSAFVAAMSHEIRTPLNAVIGYSGLLRKTKLDEEQVEYARIVDASAQHLLGIIGDILDFSQIEAGRLVVTDAPFRIRDVTDPLQGMMTALIGPKPIEVSVEVSPEIPELVRGDAVRLNQVLLNIVGNAVKFTQAGKIAVAVIAEGGDAPRLCFRVDDTGVGMSAETQKIIFQPFAQGDAPTRMRVAGTGLGLAISRRIVELMGGEIGFESEAGKGSRFWFTIPLRDVAPVAQGETAAVDGHGRMRPRHILLADDSEPSRRLAAILLRKQGHEVIEVEDGLAAVEAARERSFDLVLLDLQMPRMGGLEAARCIRKLPGPNGAACIIALTAQVLEEDRRAAAEAGMDGFLTKPFRERDLLETLQGTDPGKACHLA